MSTPIIDQFSLRSKAYLDARQSVATLADLKAIPESTVPDGFRTYCIETSCWYEYDSTNIISFHTGKWQPTDMVENSENDLEISDEDGNSIVKFFDGHVRTKNFDSSTLNTKKDILENDFEVADENGMSIVQFSNGHIRTKNFDSSKTHMSEEVVANDFEIADENGMSIVQFSGGHVRTKNFDSSNFSNNVVKARQSLLFGSPQKYVSGSTPDEDTSEITSDFINQCYDELCAQYPDLISRKEDIGTSAIGNHQIRHYTLGLTKYMLSSTSDRNIQGANSFLPSMSMQRYVVTTGVHGDERASCYGVYLAIKEILENFGKQGWADFILGNAILEIIPCSNPYGLTMNLHGNGNVSNLNRDFYTATQPETQAMQEFLRVTDFKMAMDFHNSGTPYDYLVTKQTYAYYTMYVQTSTMYAQMMYNENRERYGNSRQDFPWYYCWNSVTSNNQFHDYINNHLNKLGVSIETAGYQNKATCQYTKNQLINYTQLFIISNFS